MVNRLMESGSETCPQLELPAPAQGLISGFPVTSGATQRTGEASFQSIMKSTPDFWLSRRGVLAPSCLAHLPKAPRIPPGGDPKHARGQPGIVCPPRGRLPRGLSFTGMESQGWRAGNSWSHISLSTFAADRYLVLGPCAARDKDDVRPRVCGPDPLGHQVTSCEPSSWSTCSWGSLLF